jgi:hypothetical protein
LFRVDAGICEEDVGLHVVSRDNNVEERENAREPKRDKKDEAIRRTWMP